MAAPLRDSRPNNLRLSHDESCIFTWMPACIFSQMRGTPRKMVGETSRRSLCTVSMDSPKCTTAPVSRGKNTEKIFSAT
jgi:hypothetical protein